MKSILRPLLILFLSLSVVLQPMTTHVKSVFAATCVGPELIANGDFQTGQTGWEPIFDAAGLTNPNQASLAITLDPISGSQVAGISVGTLLPTTAMWYTRLHKIGQLSLTPNAWYQLKFDARASKSRYVVSKLQNGNGNQQRWQRIPMLSAVWQTFTDTIYFDGSYPSDLTDLYFEFATDDGTVWLDNVSLCQVSTGTPTLPTSSGSPTGFQPSGYSLAWSDEFDSTTLDTTTKWNYCNSANSNPVPYCGDSPDTGYYLVSWHKPANITINNGNLNILAKYEPTVITSSLYGSRPYTYSSGWIETRPIASKLGYTFTYGYAEASIKTPAGQNLWPAFWLMPYVSTSPFYQWPPEVDILEAYGDRPYESFHTNHVSDTHGSPPTDFVQGGVPQLQERREFSHTIPITDRFVKYGLLWEPNSLVWFVDGKEVYRSNRAPNIPMYAILNMHVGNPSLPITATPPLVTGTLQVEYVRVYQLPPTGQFNVTVWNDTNGDSLFNNSEPGLNNWSVTATNQQTGITTTAQTNASGTVTFTLAPGNYQICPAIPAGWTYTFPGQACHYQPLAAGQIQPLFSGRRVVNQNQAPTVSLTSPTSGSVLTAPATLNLAATATDSDGTIIKVAFYGDGVLLSNVTTSPYTYTWPNVIAASHVISAAAYDNAGAVAYTNNATVTVNSPSPNLLANGEFNSGASPWVLELGAALATSSTVTTAGLSGPNALMVNIGTSSNTWEPNLQQPFTPGLKSGAIYTVSFMAKASLARPFGLSFKKNAAPWTDYPTTCDPTLSGQSMTLTLSAKSFTCVLTSTVLDSAVNLFFYLGGPNISGSQVFIDAVVATMSGNTGYLSATANQAATPNAGDNNGYEGSPTNAYADGGATFATDGTSTNGSGTCTSAACADTTRDKHNFSRYGITGTLPNGASVKGIEVRLDAKANSVAGSPKIAVRLSGDGGSTWTAPMTTTVLTTGEVSYLLGSSSTLWGQSAWTQTQLSDANFRVQIISIAANNSTIFSLDWATVKLFY